MHAGMTFEALQQFARELENENVRLQRSLAAAANQGATPSSRPASEAANSGNFRAIFEHAPLAIMFTDETGSISMCNDRACTIFGAPRQRLIGFSYRQIRDQTMREAIAAALAGQKSRFEGRYRTVTGNVEVEMNANFSPWYTVDGAVAGVVGIFEDASERKQVEEELRLSQKRLQAVKEVGALATSSPDLEVVLQRILTGTIKAAGAAAGMIFLVEPESGNLRLAAADGLSDPFVSVFRNQSIRPGEGLTGWIAQSGEPIYIPEYAAHDPRVNPSAAKDEELHTFIGVPLFAADAVIGVMDILSRKPHILAEQETPLVAAIGAHVGPAIQNARLFRQLQRTEEHLQAEQDFLETLINSLDDTLFVFEPDTGKALRWNSTFRETSGYSDAEIALLKAPESYYDDEDLRRAAATTAAMRTTGTAALQLTLITKDRQRIPFEYSAALVKNPRHERPCIIAIGRDLRDRRKMEEELLKFHKLESLGILAGGIAHDFNNLLTAILGNVSLAKIHAAENQKVVKFLTDAERATGRAQDLTLQLLTFSRGGAPVKQAMAIGQIVEEAANFALHGSRSACDLAMPPNLWPAAVDPGQISQVFHNLLINAVQAMPLGGHIAIRAENLLVGQNDGVPLAAGRYVRLAVQDQGEGIAAANLGRIFDPYFSTKQHGNGLGLATAYSIVRRHDGLITVESELGIGTTFYVYLPASAEENAGSGPSLPAGGVVSLGKKILVMDDQESVRETLAHMLQQLDCEVTVARDGREALAIFRERRGRGQGFDAVILDLTIPGGMGGKETMTALLAVDPKVVGIVSSGYSNDPIMASFAAHGFRGCVAKPYTLQKLAATLHAVLTPPDARDQRGAATNATSGKISAIAEGINAATPSGSTG